MISFGFISYQMYVHVLSKAVLSTALKDYHIVNHDCNHLQEYFVLTKKTGGKRKQNFMKIYPRFINRVWESNFRDNWCVFLPNKNPMVEDKLGTPPLWLETWKRSSFKNLKEKWKRRHLVWKMSNNSSKPMKKNLLGFSN